MTAHEALTAALLAMLDRGARPACAADPEAWYSDDRETRASAVERCAGCPITDQCRAAADEGDEKHGVWAGVDRTPAARPKGPRRQEATP